MVLEGVEVGEVLEGAELEVEGVVDVDLVVAWVEDALEVGLAWLVVLDEGFLVRKRDRSLTVPVGNAVPVPVAKAEPEAVPAG